ncbi:AMP-binding protein [Falsiporphyromonas endometrii]|uniref:AMP-binding protein n=1 Tax=Falsiporphyromonas endometrii TaxID=1387297 RepID=A0ABV9K684_9PORP
MIEKNLIKLYADSFSSNWELPALTNYIEKRTYSYKDVATRIARYHELYKKLGVEEGEHIAIMGKDTAEWCIVFMSVITYGAVIVPILQDFNPKDAASILTHSDAKLIFINEGIWKGVKEELKDSKIEAAFEIQQNKILYNNTTLGLNENFDQMLDNWLQEAYPRGYQPKDVKYTDVPNDRMIILNYTSGTTGFSKGVMLTANNMAGNVTYAFRLEIMKKGDNELCFLPLAHAYSCAFNLMTPLATGAHVHLLGKIPSPKIVMKAFQEVRPNLIITVPLILEKIYRDVIAPKISKPAVKALLKFPFVTNIIRKSIQKQMIDGMGGNFHEVIVGGAALNPEVESFLKRIKFPFMVGYGMTECGPLICYENWRNWKLHSCGKALKDIMEVRIDMSESHDGKVGEIQCRGENVCLGYYKKEDITKDLFTEDGWMHTGDLGTMDKEGNVFIKGRSKTMILGSNGQNIYPEEIESKINLLPYVQECLVVSRNGRLIALVYPDETKYKKANLSREEAVKIIQEGRKEINEQVGTYEKIGKFEIQDKPFIKTPKQSIKRFLYK